VGRERQQAMLRAASSGEKEKAQQEHYHWQHDAEGTEKPRPV